MDPEERFRAIMLLGAEELTGTTSGSNRNALIEFATDAAATYYLVDRDQIHVTLSNVVTETVDNSQLGNPSLRAITGYEGDFTAEVIEP